MIILIALIIALLGGGALFGWGLFLEMATQYDAGGSQGAWQVNVGTGLFLVGAVGLAVKAAIAIARFL